MLSSVYFLLAVATLGNDQIGISMSEGSLIPRGQVSNVTAVYENLLKGYDRRKRPFHKVKRDEIQVNVFVESLSHFSEQNMEFQADLHFHSIWEDPRLSFGPANESIILQGDDTELIWLPDLYFNNARKTQVQKEIRAVVITGNGRVYHSARTLLTLAVLMDLRNYPMDEQDLNITINSYIYTTSMFHLEWLQARFTTREFSTFYMVSFKNTTSPHVSETSGMYQYLTLSVKVKRRLGYFLMQFYLPSAACTIISWLPFFMDRYGIGERMALGITTLLTEMFLFQYINSTMPQVSYVKASDQYILVSFLLIFFALLENILAYCYRGDIRKRRNKRREMPKKEQTKQVSGRHQNEVALSDIEMGHSTTLEQPNDNDSKPVRDLSKFIDQTSRVVFPAVYVVFVVVYFAKGLTYYD